MTTRFAALFCILATVSGGVALKAQTLTLRDFRQLQATRVNACQSEMLLSKGFRPVSSVGRDSAGAPLSLYCALSKPKPDERIGIMESDYDGEQYFEVVYCMVSLTGYKALVASLPGLKFKFSKRDHCYMLPSGSYAGEKVYADGKQILAGKPVYRIRYIQFVGKELSLPPSPVGSDTVISSK